ncbi:hypothetical protein EBT16_05625 [bacterium]|nr:hypothetical protein [bacterium]
MTSKEAKDLLFDIYPYVAQWRTSDISHTEYQEGVGKIIDAALNKTKLEATYYASEYYEEQNKIKTEELVREARIDGARAMQAKVADVVENEAMGAGAYGFTDDEKNLQHVEGLIRALDPQQVINESMK